MEKTINLYVNLEVSKDKLETHGFCTKIMIQTTAQNCSPDKDLWFNWEELRKNDLMRYCFEHNLLTYPMKTEDPSVNYKYASYQLKAHIQNIKSNYEQIIWYFESLENRNLFNYIINYTSNDFVEY